MENKEIYPDFFARFYDVIYNKIRTGVDTNFFLKKIAGTSGPVLEVGVGTGRFFIDALNNGADIFGIDICSNMINRLKEKLAKKHHNRVKVQDVKTFNFDKKFDLIIAPFRIFSHIISVADQLLALDNIYKHLKPGAQLILDLFVPNLKSLSEGIDNVVDFDQEYMPGKKLKRITSMRADLVNQVSFVNMKFIWEEDNQKIKKEWDFKMRFYFRFEIEHLIKRSKFQLENIYGDFEENQLSPGSKEFIVVCKKKS